MNRLINLLPDSKYKNLLKGNQRIAEDFLWRAIQTASKQGVMTLIIFISAYYLSPTDFGMLNYYLALFALVVIFCNFGVSTATSKFIAQYHGVDEVKKNQTLFSSIALVIITVTLVVLLAATVGSGLIGIDEQIFLLFIPYLLLVPLSNVLDGYFRGIKSFKILSLTSIVAGIISVIVAVILLRSLSMAGAIIAQSIVYFTAVVFLIPFLRNLKISFSRKRVREVLSYSLILGFANLAFFLYSRVDILILKQFNYIVEIGHYELINRVFQILLLPAILLGQVIAPDISKLAGLKKWSVILKKHNNYFSLMLITGISVALLIIIMGPFIMKLLLSKYYTGTFMTIAVILTVLFPFKWWGVFLSNGFITSTGFAKITLVVTTVFGIFNIIFDYILINTIGFLGIFVSTLIVHTISIVVSTIWYLKVLYKLK